jgi:hypothetical protein
MSIDPPQSARGRRISLAGLLAFIAAIAVALTWFLEESRWNSRWAAAMLAGFAWAAAIVTFRSPTLIAASIRLAVGASLLLVSVAWHQWSPTAVGWQYRSGFHWVVYWALATVALPLLVGPGLARAWVASGRERWIARLKQVPRGFLLYLLAILLSLAVGFAVESLAPPRAPLVGRRPRAGPPPYRRPLGPPTRAGGAPSTPKPPGAARW